MNDDAYNLVCKLPDKDPDRDLNKLILLTAFNAESPEDTASAVFDEMRNDGLLKKYKLNSYQPIYDKLELLKAKHKPIEGEIANDYGTKLQYYDSCIIERLIEYFTKYNIPILTIHDSVICHTQYAEFIKDKMWQFYSEIIHKLLKCKIKYVSINPHAGRAIRLINGYAHYKKYIETYNSIKSKLDNTLNTELQEKYQGKVPTIKNSIITIKPDQRTNVCSSKCNHSKRMKYKLKYQPTIKLELVQHTDNYTNTLSIK